MKMHTIVVELDEKNATAVHAEKIIDQLEHLHPAVGEAPRGWLSVTMSLPAEHVAQAVVLALAAVEQAAGRSVVAVTAMAEEEFDAREGWETLPDLLSVTEVAERLGVSRQAVLDRIRRNTLPASKVGREYAIPAAAIERAEQ